MVGEVGVPGAEEFVGVGVVAALVAVVIPVGATVGLVRSPRAVVIQSCMEGLVG